MLYDKTHNMYPFHFDSETEWKTIIDDTSSRIGDELLPGKGLANRPVKELASSFDNHYTVESIPNSQAGSRPCENNLTEEEPPYDDIVD